MSIEIWKDESVLEQLVNKIRALEFELVMQRVTVTRRCLEWWRLR